MSGQCRRTVLSIESMESRDLLSGLTPALDLGTSEIVPPGGTEAVAKATSHDIEHVDARHGAVMSVARGQGLLGETRGDVHTNVIGGHVHPGIAPSAAVPAVSSLFDTSATFSVTGLNPTTSTQATQVGFAGFAQNAGNPTTSKVTVTSTSLGRGNSEVLDLFFQRTPVGPSAPPLNVGNTLSVGRPSPIKLNLTGNQKVTVRYFLYFSTATGIQQTSIDLNKEIRFGGTTPVMRVERNPLNQTKVFFSLKDETRTARDGTLVLTDFSCCGKFFELGDYTNNLKTLGLVSQPTNPLNGIHFDAVVTPARA
jgi:hypothetical protein